MPMNFEIKIEKQELTQEETSIIRALQILQDICSSHDNCKGTCPLWSMEQEECAISYCSNPLDLDISPCRTFRAVI